MVLLLSGRSDWCIDLHDMIVSAVLVVVVEWRLNSQGFAL